MVIVVYMEVVDLTSWGSIVSLSGKAVSQEETISEKILRGGLEGGREGGGREGGREKSQDQSCENWSRLN